METAVIQSVKRSREMFLGNYGLSIPDNIQSQRLKLTSKILDEYESVKTLPAKLIQQQPHVQPVKNTSANQSDSDIVVTGTHPYPTGPGIALTAETSTSTQPSSEAIDSLIDTLPISKREDIRNPNSTALVRATPQGQNQQALTIRQGHSTPKPKWHAPWKMMRVISGHMGWVRSVAVDSSNEWFATGAADKTIKIWDMAAGTLKLTLTGHIGAVRGLVVSDRHPYLFSVGDDKMVKCWDLEVNKVVRHYHGHLSGVYAIAMHPTLDILFTAGRDAAVRVWDIRSMQEIFTLTGHTNTIASLVSQAAEPQVISASMDSTVRLWDLAMGRSRTVLTNHKKSVRSVVLHPNEYTFATASPENIKQWKCPDGDFLQNLSGHKAIINTMSVNADDVLFSGSDTGSLRFWDWKSGHCFQEHETIVQPGSLEGESGIFASTFDRSGSRLITCEADKTIKIWKEDENATEETHPIAWKASLKKTRY